MSRCRYCEAPLDEGAECDDKRACSKRIASRARKRMTTKTYTKPYVGGFDPVKAYNDAMGRP